MIKYFFLIIGFFNYANSQRIINRKLNFLNEEMEWKQFSIFQEKFNKKYDTLIELEKRFQIFRNNLYNIIIHNLDNNQNFTMDINQFTDLNSDEFKKLYLTNLKSDYGNYGCEIFSTNSSKNIPESIDWRKKGAVTSVKDQGQCGSCWTFSSTGSAEGAWAIATGQLINLSEEQLVNCAKGILYGSNGCSGGSMEGADKYLIKYGQCSDSEYPYTSGNGVSGSCKSCNPVAKFTSCSNVKQNDQISLKVAVSKQPISVAIEADTRYFQSYSSGVLTSSNCGTELDHGVLIVGYGEENNIAYWLVKNSWGTTWGESGYVKILRSDSNNDPGICGIAMDPSFITV
jgi:C1A family cysteine protease